MARRLQYSARSAGGPAHGCIANRAQDGPVLDREGLGQFLGEVRTRQRHATYLDGLGWSRSVGESAKLIPHSGEGLWARYFTAAPRPRTPSELRYSDRRLRSRN